MELRGPRPNYFLYWAVFCVNLLSINTATVFSWASPSITKLTSDDPSINPLGRPINSFEESLVASLATFGAIIGTITTGFIAEKLGRKRTLVIFSTCFFFCNIILANATQINFIYAVRMIMGISAGCVLCLLPSYVGEISEDSNRGALGSVFGVMSCLGHLLAFGIGPLVSIKTFAYILVVPVILFFTTFVPFVPESPYHFLSRDENDKAERALKKFRSNSNTEKELLYLKENMSDGNNEKVTIKDILCTPAPRKGLLVSCGLLLIQQSLGIGVVLTYLQPILEASGNVIPANIASLIIGLIQVVSCSGASIVIDHLGKKILLYVSAVGCSVSLFGLGAYFILRDAGYYLEPVFWLPLASLISYYILFNIGYATIPWSICGELFATNTKSICASISSCLCLVASFAVSLCFPFLRDAFGMGGVFCLFATLGMLSNIFVVLCVPETKGKSFQEIQNELSKVRKLPDNIGYDAL